MADDPILNMIRGGGGAATATADDEEQDPILKMIQNSGLKPGSDLRTPSLDELTRSPSAIPTASPAEQGAAIGQPMISLAPPGSDVATYQTPKGWNEYGPMKAPGMIKQGNLDLTRRPVVQNDDGTTSSEYSTSFQDENGHEVLVPTVVNGKFLTPNGKKPPEGSPTEKEMFKRAWNYYLKTGENLGIFDNPEDADSAAEMIHSRPTAAAPPLTSIDATKIPLNPFTNQYEIPQPSVEDIRAQNAAEDAQRVQDDQEKDDLARLAVRGLPVTKKQAAEQAASVDAANQIEGKVARKIPLPAFTPGGPYAPGIRLSNVGELEDLTNEYLNNPAVPKTAAQGAVAGSFADAVKMMFSPINLLSAGAGGVEAATLSKANQLATDAVKLAQEYDALRTAGATETELAEAAGRMRKAVQAAKKAQALAVTGVRAGVGAGVGFGAQGVGGVAQGIQDKNLPEVLGGVGQAVLGGAALHATRAGGGIEEQVKASARQAAQEATKGSEVSAKRTVQVPAEAQQPPAAPQLPQPPGVEGGTPQPPKVETVGAGEATVPEKPETLNAQVDALAKGTNPVVYFPKGTKSIPPPPDNVNVTVIPGNKPGAGTYYHDDSVTPADIKKAVKNGTYGELLGHEQTKQEAVQGTPESVVARDASGVEQKASVVDTSKPEVVAAQAATLAKQFPEATISVEKPEDVVAERQAPSAKAPENGAARPLSAQTQVPGKPLETAKNILDTQLKPWQERHREDLEKFQEIIDDPNTTPEVKAGAEAGMRELLQGKRKIDMGPPQGTEERRVANEKPKPGQAATLGEAALPQFAYRVRDVGEGGIQNIKSHSQATTSEEEAQGYIEHRGKIQGKPQELVKIDLSKLKPEDYQVLPREGKSPWVKFNRPLAESEVEKVAPEGEAQPEDVEALGDHVAAIEDRLANGEPIPLEDISTGHELANKVEHHSWMNGMEVEEAAQRYATHPVLGKATKFLKEFMDEVDSHSDGWPYWRKPAHAAQKLMDMIQSPGAATEENFRKALAPIRAFYTKHGTKAGMAFPKVEVANAEKVRKPAASQSVSPKGEGAISETRQAAESTEREPAEVAAANASAPAKPAENPAVPETAKGVTAPWTMARINQEVERIDGLDRVADKEELQGIGRDKSLPMAIHTAAVRKLLGPGHSVPRKPVVSEIKSPDLRAYDMGAAAFKAGKPRVAASDENLKEVVNAAVTGGKYKQWLEGWDDAQRVSELEAKKPTDHILEMIRGESKPLESEQNLTPGGTIEPEKEPANAQATESVGNRSEEAPANVSPENGEPARLTGEAGRLGTERGEPSDRGIGTEHVQRNEPTRSGQRSEEESHVPAERGGHAEPRGDRIQSRSGEPGNDYRITEADHIGEGSIQEKYRLNVAAIKILKELEASGRSANPEEQSQLVRYSGWGWTGNLLNEYHDKWRNERAELQKLLTDEEYASAVRSTTNAHYTSPEVVRAVWDAVKRLGFTGGRILEPSAGIGHFLGLMPNDLYTNSKKTAIELDQTSGKILRQLYQTADVRIQGFQELRGLNDFYDLAISNVPFGDYGVNDPAYKGKKYLTESIHNYFIARMLDKVRPGGLAAIITSHHSLDNYDTRARQAFLDRGDLLGAIRLPGGAFQKNAGTEVTTDMLFFRRRGADEKPASRPFVKSNEMQLEGGKASVNEYFQDHPAMALGTHTLGGTMYGYGKNYELKAGKGNLADLIEGAIGKLPENAMRERAVPESVTKAATVEAIPDYGDTKAFGYKVQDGKVFQSRDGQLVHQPDFPKANIEPLKQMLNIRDVTRELFQAEGRGLSGRELSAARGRLNRIYDAFVKKYGYLNRPNNARILKEDPDGPLLLALEKWDTKTKTGSKSDVFFKQTIAPRKEVTSVANVADALPASLAEKGKIDFGYMSKISGRPEDEIKTELRAAGLAFQAPQGHWETKDEYLSGDVRAKLRDAEEAAKLDKAFAQNVEALKGVQPRDLEPGEIDVRLGTPWIPEQDVADFIDEAILGHQRYGHKTKVAHVASEALWRIDNRGGSNEAAQTKWGTNRMTPLQLIEGALNLKRPTLYDDLGEGKKAVNEKETLAAREKLEQIEEEFGKWIFKDADRAERLTKFYNEHSNNLVDRDYDGSHLTLPGKAAGITMRPHQMNGIWRSIVGGNTLYAHVVGAGKTFTIIGSAMEKRRLGLSKKPMIVVPNHLVEQWGNDFLKLYPQARVLAATKKDFEAKNRKTIMSRIATGDWDAVIVPHASFGLLPVSDATFKQYAQKQLDMLGEHIRELSDEGGQLNKRTVKQLEKAKERIKVRMERAANKERKDNTINLEDTGVDSLYVDEAHMYKNLFFPTKMGNINGIPKSDAQRAFDMYLKTKYISSLNNNGGITFATGTPISNTMAEIYTMMRYLDEGRLEQAGMAHFDAWATAFGNTVQNMEVSPEDPTKFRISTRFAKFSNVPELKRMFRQSADVVHPEDLEGIVKVPDIEGGKPKVIEVPASQRVLDYIQELGKRATAIRRKEVRPDEDNMLKITSEGRKIALDYRSMFPGAGDDGESKITSAAKHLAAIYDETRSTKRTQAVMLDLMTPSDAGKKKGQFNAYSDLKNKLIGLGVPAEKIAFIHDAKSDTAKQALFDKVNAGDVAVILGSSDKMGVGTNIQERLIALHHIDAPWRPSDIEQREGRIIRQGNTNPAVQIYRYVTQGTFDAYMWSTISRKASFIKEMMQHGYDQRELEDVDGATLSYAEAAAIATGDKRVLEKVQTDADVDRLQKLKSIHEQSITTNRVKLAQIPQRIEGLEASRDAIRQDIKLRDANKGDEFRMTVGKKTYTERKDAGAALNAAIEANRGSGRMKVGSFQGFDIEADGSGNPYLYGKASHGFSVNHESPLGTIQSAERNLSTMESYAANREEDIKALQRDLEARKSELEKPFAKQAQLDKLLAKQKELNDALAVNKEDKTMAGADENQVFDENFKSLGTEKPKEEGEGEGISDIIKGAASGEIAGAFLPFQILGKLIQKAFMALRPRAAQTAAPEPRVSREGPEGIPRTPPGAKKPVERAGNIRLDKLDAPEDVINEIRRAAKENAAEFNEQRRGKIPFKETKSAAEKLVEEGMFTEDDLKKIKAGTALNAEELLAARGMLIESARKVREAAANVKTNGSVDNVLAFQEALMRHEGIQKAVSGAVAEAGRALSQQRIIAKALQNKDKTAHERVLDALGGQELSEEAARRLAEIPEDDPVAMVNFLRSQKHWTTAQKLEAYWMANVLSSPRTPIKKVLGDVILGSMETARRFVDAPVDKILAMIQGRKSELTMREAAVAPLAYISALPEGLRKAAYILAHGFDISDPLAIEMPHRFEFKGGAKNPLNLPGRALSAATKLFQVLAFQGELHARAVRQAAKEGLKDGALRARAAELVQQPTDTMIDEAMKTAELSTYVETPDAFSRMLLSMRDKVTIPKGVPLAGGLHPMRFVIPFVQIPYNLAKNAIRYSPAGFLRMNDFEHAKSPEATKTLSRALIGSAVMALFAYLAAKKLLTGAAPSDPAGRDAFYREGKQPFSIRIGNRWISYKAAGPFALSAAAVAAWHDRHANKDTMPVMDEILAGAGAMGQALADESFLRGLKNVLDAIQDPARGASRWASGTLGGFVPMESALRTLNDALDPAVRNPQSMYERIAAGLPIVSKTVKQRMDALGRPSEKSGTSGLASLVPGGVSKAEPESELDAELGRLNNLGLKNLGFAGKHITVDNYKLTLTSDEQDQYQKLRGTFLRSYLKQTFASPEYKQMTDADKVQAAEEAIRQATQDAHEEVGNQILAERLKKVRTASIPRRPPGAAMAARP